MKKETIFSMPIDPYLLDDGYTKINGITNEELKKRLLLLRICSQILAVAYEKMYADPEIRLDKELLIVSLQESLKKISRYRTVFLNILKVVDELTGQIVFNDLTLNAISMYEQEVRFAPFLQKAVSFTPSELGQIVSTLFDSRIDFFGKTESKSSPSPVMLERRLSLLEMSVSLGHIMVFFDYFQQNKNAFLKELLTVAVDAAEALIQSMRLPSTLTEAPDYMINAIRRCYQTSAQLLCQVYKDCAHKDVACLKDMSEVNRSILVNLYELSGMPYHHILEKFQASVEYLKSLMLLFEKSDQI